MNYYEKQRALANLALSLKAPAGPSTTSTLPSTTRVGDIEWPRWDGHAEHKHFPGLKVVSANFMPNFHLYERQPAARTPPGFMWHIEQAGKPVAKGKGFSECNYNTTSADHQRVVAAITEACAKLTAAAAAATEAQSPRGIAANTATPVAITADGNWIWVKFAQKPDELVRVQLKQLGGSFSKRRQAWYFTSPQYLDQLRALFPVATPQ